MSQWADAWSLPGVGCLGALRVGEFIEVFVDDTLTLSTVACTGPGTGSTARIENRAIAPEIRPITPAGIPRDDRGAAGRTRPLVTRL